MLASMTLPASDWLPPQKGKLFQCPANSKATVRNISVVNGDTIPHTVNVYLNTDLTPDSSRPIFPSPLLLAPGCLIQDDREYKLQSNDYFEGSSDAENTVTWVISGELGQ